MATLEENVAARKAARQSGTPIVNAAPAPKTAPAPAPIAVKQVYIQPNPSYNPPVAKPQQDEGYDKRGAGNPVYNDPTQLTDAYSTQEHRRTQLTEQLSGGKITQQDYDREISQMFTKDQYNSALKNLESGYSGVDPLGFGNTTIKGVEGFDTLEDAQKAAQDYYTKYGTSDPRIDAAIYNFQNPEAYKGATSSGTKYAPRTTIGRQSAATAKTIAELDAQEEAAIANVRATGGQGYGGDASSAESEIRKQFQGERNKLLKEQELLNKQSEFSASEAERRKTEASMGKDESEFSSAAIPDIDATIQKMTEMANNSMGIKQEVFNAFLPSIQSLAGQIKKIRSRADEIDTSAERSALAEEQIAPEKELALRRENQFNQRLKNDEALLKENRDILVEANRLTTEALDLDKKITQENQRINEVRQMAANVEGEKKLRRSLNAIGIENSPNATAYLQTKIQEAADTLQSMITTNSLTILKYDNGRLQLNNSLRATLNEFDSKRAILNNTFDDNIFNLDQYVSGARSEALKGLKDDWQTLLKEEDKLMMDFGKKLEEATIKGLEMHADAEKLDRQETLADKRLQSQEDRADQRLQMTMSNQERMQMNTDKKTEKADEKSVRDEFKAVGTQETVKNYGILRDTQSKINALVDDAKADPKNSQKLGAAIELAMTLTAKGSDPTTGVRDGELKKFGMAQSVIDKVEAFGKAVTGGDLSGITVEMVSAYAEASTLLSNTQKEEAQAQYAGAINRLVEFNNRSEFYNIDPSTITLPSGISIPEWAVGSYYEDQENSGESMYDTDWNDPSDWQSSTGTGEEIAGSPHHTGVDRYAVDIDGRIGDPLRSPTTGSVVKVVRGDKGLGNYVVVEDSEGYQWTLGHMDKVRVKIGDSIEAGIALGTIGNTGNVIPGEGGDGSHVHLRVTKNGQPVDSKPLLKNSHA